MVPSGETGHLIVETNIILNNSDDDYLMSILRLNKIRRIQKRKKSKLVTSDRIQQQSSNKTGVCRTITVKYEEKWAKSLTRIQ